MARFFRILHRTVLATLQHKVSAPSKHEQTSHQAPASVTVIGAEEIRRFGYQNVTEVLKGVHGFFANNDLKPPPSVYAALEDRPISIVECSSW